MIRKSYIGMHKGKLDEKQFNFIAMFFLSLSKIFIIVIKLFIISFYCVNTGNEGQVTTRSWVDMMKINLVHQPLDLSAYPALPGVQEIGKI